jgi:hypothetical protein
MVAPRVSSMMQAAASPAVAAGSAILGSAATLADMAHSEASVSITQGYGVRARKRVAQGSASYAVSVGPLDRILIEMGSGEQATWRGFEIQGNDLKALPLDYLKIERANVMGYSLGGGAAMEVAIRHPEKVRKVVVISHPMRRDGWVKEANDFWPNFSLEMMKGTPAETEREKLNPVPGSFPDFFNHIKAAAMRPWDFGADKFAATKAPFFFINGDADGVRMEHITEMYRLKGGGSIHGDMQPRPESRLAIIPNTTHVTLINRMSIIVPMVNDFLDSKPQKQ